MKRRSGSKRDGARPEARIGQPAPARFPHTITVDGITLQLIVERKAVKNINARLRESTLSISAPLNLPDKKLGEVIDELARKLVRRAHALKVNDAEDALALAQRVAARFPTRPEVADVTFVTTQTAKWGSFSTGTRSIRLNAALRRMPRWVLEYVVAHELAHAIHPNHGPAFWALTRNVFPETDRAKAFLEGVAWLGQHWEGLDGVERALLTGVSGCDDEAPATE